MRNKNIDPVADMLRYGEETYLVIMRTAEEFYSTYCLCKKEKEKDSINELILLDPSAVLLALSCELYLKALYSLKHKVSKKSDLLPGHKLFDLYTQLDDLREDVFGRFKKNYEGQSKNKTIYDRAAFEEVLEEYQNVFIKFRYSYENEIRSINFLFLECLYLSCKEVLDAKNSILTFKYEHKIGK